MTDPAAAATGEQTQPRDILPVVPLARQSNVGLYTFAVVLAVGGVWLLAALSANRAELAAPRTTATLDQTGSQISAAPPLALPPDYSQVSEPSRPQVAFPDAGNSAGVASLPHVVLRRSSNPVTSSTPNSPPYYVPPPVPFQGTEPAGSRPPVVFEAPFTPSFAGAGIPPSGSADSGDDRVTAGRLANPSRTVPRGTVIAAVLETALDSTRPGAARGLVQRDIHSFDGSRVLIPRGSRLYGEYAADLSGGQRRAAIQWTRLLRPDGVTIELDSPASDPLGRAGVSGKVDTKFFQRFGGAILQSVLDIGVGVATRKAGDGVIVALPGSTQNVRVTDQQQIQPTLKARQGTSVSVFVARDLDFSTVDP